MHKKNDRREMMTCKKKKSSAMFKVVFYKALFYFDLVRIFLLCGGYVTLVCATAFKADWVGG